MNKDMEALINEEKPLKRLLEDEARLYLDGLGIKKVGSVVGRSNATVHDDLTNKLKKYNNELYLKVLDKLEENKEKSVEDPSIQKRVFDVYKMLTEDNKTIETIANELNESYFTIERDLTRRLPKLHELNPDLVKEEDLIKVKEVLEGHSKSNLTTKKK